MDPNRYSSRRPDGLAALAAAVDELAAQDLDSLSDPALAEQVLALRRLVDRPEGQCSRPSPPWMPAAALEPLARPADAHDRRSGSQRTADASVSWPAGPWKGAGSPRRPVGSDPS
jgi:hypothetical protein